METVTLGQFTRPPEDVSVSSSHGRITHRVGCIRRHPSAVSMAVEQQAAKSQSGFLANNSTPTNPAAQLILIRLQHVPLKSPISIS